MATATTTPTTHCPGCGAKIPSTVSICPYCVTPLKTGGGASAPRAIDATVERLAHMKEKPEYAEGMSFDPMEGPDFQRASSRLRRGIALMTVGVITLGNGLATAGGSAGALRLRVVAGAAILFFGAWTAFRARAARREILSRPLLKRPARVADRRSETTIQGSKGETTYFFDLEFEDGSRAEFRFPGRGPADNPLTNGVTGIAYTRGVELVAFKRIRV